MRREVLKRQAHTADFQAMVKFRNFKIGNKVVGIGAPCFIIAEAGSNHDCDIKKALNLIDIAADAGADAVKFQVFSAEKIAAQTRENIVSLEKDKFGAYGKTLFDLYKKLELPRQWLPKLNRHAQKRKIIFSATPFDEEAVDQLEKINIPFYKIASFELVHLPLIKYASRKGKPVILSTGMATVSEIKDAVDAVRQAGNRKYALLHCAIGYPPPTTDLNLSAMEMMFKKFSCPIGYSDHTLGITVPIAAVAMGAKIIEKHFTLGKDLKGPDHDFSLSPSQLKDLVYAVRETEKSIGSPVKKAADSEKISLLRGRRSIFAARDIARGDVIDAKSVIILRPGCGLMPKYFDKIIGRKARVDIYKNDPITWNKIG